MDTNPYEPPTLPPQNGITGRQLWFILLAAVIVIGLFAGYQAYRFQQLRKETLRAVRQAEIAQMRAKESEMVARKAQEKFQATEERRQQEAKARAESVQNGP